MCALCALGVRAQGAAARSGQQGDSSLKMKFKSCSQMPLTIASLYSPPTYPLRIFVFRTTSSPASHCASLASPPSQPSHEPTLHALRLHLLEVSQPPHLLQALGRHSMLRTRGQRASISLHQYTASVQDQGPAIFLASRRGQSAPGEVGTGGVGRGCGPSAQSTSSTP
jgi:hypothetical protein